MGKFVIKTTDAGCHFVLKADNGEIIATSQVYKSKDSCKKGIEGNVQFFAHFDSRIASR